MGWSGTNKEKGVAMLQFFRTEFNFENETRSHEILDCAVVGWNTAYLAVKNTDKITGESSVSAFVCLIRHDRHSRCNFWYKDMSEEEGPNKRDCPERILKLLTPIDESKYFGYAKKWRMDCLENLQKRKLQKKNWAFMRKNIKQGNMIFINNSSMSLPFERFYSNSDSVNAGYYKVKARQIDLQKTIDNMKTNI